MRRNHTFLRICIAKTSIYSISIHIYFNIFGILRTYLYLCSRYEQTEPVAV